MIEIQITDYTVYIYCNLDDGKIENNLEKVVSQKRNNNARCQSGVVSQICSIFVRACLYYNNLIKQYHINWPRLSPRCSLDNSNTSAIKVHQTFKLTHKCQEHKETRGIIGQRWNWHLKRPRNQPQRLPLCTHARIHARTTLVRDQSGAKLEAG